MGGALAVTIRDKNDQWHKMVRNTNPTPHYFRHSDFLSGGNMLTTYLTYWDSACEEFDNGSNRENLYYCDPDNGRGKFAPQEYGIVFIDLIEKRFWNCQGYSSYDKLSLSHILIEKMNNPHYYQELLSEYWNRVVALSSMSDTQPMTFDSSKDMRLFIERIDTNDDKRMYTHSFDLDMLGYDFRYFPEHDMKSLLDLILANYELRIEEETLWTTF